MTATTPLPAPGGAPPAHRPPARPGRPGHAGDRLAGLSWALVVVLLAHAIAIQGAMAAEPANRPPGKLADPAGNPRTAQGGWHPELLAQYMGIRCMTQLGACQLPSPAPVNSPCWCPSPYGQIRGVVR